MARAKPVKKAIPIIKKKTGTPKKKVKGTKRIKLIYNNLGGHLINPPEHCIKKVKASDGGIWCDLAICFSVCKEKCERYKWFNKAGSEELREEWKKCGVKQVVF